MRGEGVLELDMPWRVIEPDPRVAATRGCVAFARGPLIYCLEGERLVPYAFNRRCEPDARLDPYSESRCSVNATDSPAAASAPT